MSEPMTEQKRGYNGGTMVVKRPSESHSVSMPAKVKILNSTYMLLELSVLWLPEDFDPESDENLKRKIKMETGTLIVNTSHVAAFHSHSNGNAMIRLDSGDVFEALVAFNSFREIMEQEQIQKDMLVSGDN